ncbi:MAG: peptide chain release factor 2 [Kiritimatiellae bacterium]|nr:peptide chain release factor 2 [Kiritimatiellia bacterium]
MLDEIKEGLAELRERVEEMGGIFDVERRRKHVAELQAEAAAPDFWNDQNKAKANFEKAAAERALLEPYDILLKNMEDVGVLAELAEAEEDANQRDAALAEAKTHLEAARKGFRDLRMRVLLSGRFDANNAYLSLHAGAGGTESCDWAEMLLRMYRRYAESHGFEVAVLDYLAGDEAGVKSVTFLVSGPYAYGYFKAERGVHRLVRISPFDSNKRRHTSFVSLDVVAEIDETVEVEINEKDLRVDTFRSGGAGGQHVNVTDSAVRITHLPTGIVVQCQAERSQHSNRNKAMKMLRARLYEWELDQKRKEMEKFYAAKGEIAWGRQIRSYVMQPYTMVKDHRTDTETSNVMAVLDGDLDLFIEAYLQQACGHESAGGNSRK